MHTIPLPGCAPVPLAHYLKALGILRLVSEDCVNGDNEARGFWKNGEFYLSTKLGEQELVDFFIVHYQPTPVIVPWSGGDFFDVNWTADTEKLQNTFKDRPTSSQIIEAFLVTKSLRLADYRQVLALIPKALAVSEIQTKKDIEGVAKSENKARFLQALRNFLPDKSVAWLDCATAIEADQLAFNTILGSGGGSDGNSHFSDNFMQAVWMVLPEFIEQQLRPTKAASGEAFDSSAALRASLFGSSEQSATISKFSPVLFDSSRVGGVNSTSGFDADSASNPWDFVLMIEGAFLFAGAVSKKLRSLRTGSARFPFLLDATPVGLASVGAKDQGREIWLPLWEKASSYSEITQVFAEARIEKFGRTATTGFDAFIALARHGVDRGIPSFQRIGLVRGRVGGDNYYTSIDQGIFRVRDDDAIDLLRPLDKWYSDLRRFGNDEIECPASVRRSLRQYEASIAVLSQQGGREALLRVLISLGQIEKSLARSLKQTKKAGISPTPLLTPDWLERIGIQAPEFRLALTLAATQGRYGDREMLFRQHLEPVFRSSKGVYWEENPDNDVISKEGDFAGVLNGIFSRRLLKAGQSRSVGFPDTSLYPARLNDLASFIEGRTDDKLLSDLLWGLVLIDWMNADSPDVQDERVTPSSLYALLRLCFRKNDRDNEPIPLVRAIHHWASQGQGTRAADFAIRRLHASGFPVAIEQLRAKGEVVRRTAASLLFPIALFDFELLEKSILRPKEPTSS